MNPETKPGGPTAMTNEAERELKACPFCGGKNVKTFGPYGWYRQWGISHSCKSFYSGAQELAQGFHSESAAVDAWNTRPTDDLAVAVQWQPMATAPTGGYIIVGGEGEDGWLMLRVRHEEGHDPAAWCLGHDDCGDPVFATHWCADVIGTPYDRAALSKLTGGEQP